VENYFDEYEPRKRWWILVTAVIVIFVIAGGYLAWRLSRMEVPAKNQTESTKLPRMANLPPKKEALKPVQPSYSPDAPLLEQVRAAMRNGIDPESAVAMAKSLPDRPERADAAFILWEYAAEAGHAEAALIVARYFDPTDTGDCGTIIKDPEAAYGWYQAALSAGQSEAKNHFSDFKQWLENEAAQGSFEAREILKSWQ
jgi:TPR repeat protein